MLGRKTVALDVGEQFAPHHVFAEFFRARVGIVVGAVPINRGIFGNDFVAALARHGHGRNLAESAQAVRVPGPAGGELDDFQCAAQVHREAAFFRFAIERRGAVDHRLGGSRQASIFGGFQAGNVNQ